MPTSVIQAGYLHDVIEDTRTMLTEVNDNFGRYVSDIVWACTGEGDTRKEKNLSIYSKIKDFPDAQNVKVADRIANITTIFSSSLSMRKKYISEYDEFMHCVPLADHGLLNELQKAVRDAKKS